MKRRMKANGDGASRFSQASYEAIAAEVKALESEDAFDDLEGDEPFSPIAFRVLRGRLDQAPHTNGTDAAQSFVDLDDDADYFTPVAFRVLGAIVEDERSARLTVVKSGAD